MVRGGQPIIDFVAANIYRLYVRKMKAVNFQDDITSIPTDFFKEHSVLLFDLTSMQDALKNFPQPDSVEKPLKLKLNFT